MRASSSWHRRWPSAHRLLATTGRAPHRRTALLLVVILGLGTLTAVLQIPERSPAAIQPGRTIPSSGTSRLPDSSSASPPPSSAGSSSSKTRFSTPAPASDSGEDYESARLIPSAALAPKVAAVCERVSCRQSQGKLRKSGAGARECIPDERVLKETQLRFPPFILPMPRFVSSEDREWFLSQRVIKEFVNASLSCFARPADIACPSLDAQISPYDVIIFWTDKFVTGKNLELADGAFGQYQGCSWSTKYDTYLKEYPSFQGKTPLQWEKLAPMIVVQGWSFQHLVDGVLPRLMQGWEVLQEDPNITVLVDYNLARFPVVEKIWEHLLPKERLVIFEPTTIFKGKLWYQSCQSPPFHPYLWKKMRELFGYEELPFDKRNVIVYLGRGKGSGQTFNPGRSVVNQDELMEQLESFVAKRNGERAAAGRLDRLEVVTFNHADFPSLDATIKFFNRAKVLIGPHGGSFYNMLFTPSHTLTIEFMPKSWPQDPNFIIWEQAVMLDHNYYQLPYPAVNGGDVQVDVAAILSILSREIRL